jgi:hypothetical protein
MDGMRAHDHDDEHLHHEHDSEHEHDAHEAELTAGEHQLDLAAVRASWQQNPAKRYANTRKNSPTILISAIDEQ